MKKSYQNYIFDLYGTLLDIRTDERKKELWVKLSALYAVYGCGYTWKELRRSYDRAEKEERKKMQQANGSPFPEIRLERVFVRLLLETVTLHPCERKIAGKLPESWRKEYQKEPEAVLEKLMKSEWAYFIANAFRTYSRDYVKPYEGAEKKLRDLKKAKKRIYLLSNAQRIFTYPELLESGLLPFFDGVYLSSDYDRKKPDPAFLKLLLEAEGLKKEETVMIGNELFSDVRIALECGIDSIFLNTQGIKSNQVKADVRTLMKETGAEKKRKPREAELKEVPV